jgi:RimJ/RimL family protein N-acetyltransferase
MQINVPHTLKTERLFLRAVQAGDGALINEAVNASHEALKRWMPWARSPHSPAESETFAREAAARFRALEEFSYCIFLTVEPGSPGAGRYIGQIGLHHLDWEVPCFELGYWLRSDQTGHGYMTEAVRALAEMSFATLGAQRLEIRCDERNRASAAVAQRAGFTLEARMPRKARANDGSLATILLFSRLRPDE